MEFTINIEVAQAVGVPARMARGLRQQLDVSWQPDEDFAALAIWRLA